MCRLAFAPHSGDTSDYPSFGDSVSHVGYSGADDVGYGSGDVFDCSGSGNSGSDVG